jgi:excisionase family DNA binding protein
MNILTRKLSNATMPDISEFQTVSDAAKALKFHPETIRRLVRDGILMGKKWGKEWLVLKTSVDEYKKQTGDNKHNSRRK